MSLLDCPWVLSRVVQLAGGTYRTTGLRACCRACRDLLAAPKHFGDEEDMLIWAAQHGDMEMCSVAMEHGACAYFSMAKAAICNGRLSLFKKFCEPKLRSDTGGLRGSSGFYRDLVYYAGESGDKDTIWYIYSMYYQEVDDDLIYVISEDYYNQRSYEVIIQACIKMYGGLTAYLSTHFINLLCTAYGATGNSAYLDVVTSILQKSGEHMGDVQWFRVARAASLCHRTETLRQALINSSIEQRLVGGCFLPDTSIASDDSSIYELYLIYYEVSPGELLRDKIECVKYGSASVYKLICQREHVPPIESGDEWPATNGGSSMMHSDFELEHYSLVGDPTLVPRETPFLSDWLNNAIDYGDYFLCKKLIAKGGDPTNAFWHSIGSHQHYSTSIIKMTAKMIMPLQPIDMRTIAEMVSKVEGGEYARKIQNMFESWGVDV